MGNCRTRQRKGYSRELKDHNDGITNNTSTIITASGDGDFEPAVRRLREKGKFIAIVSQRASLSKSLLSSADRVESYECLPFTHETGGQFVIHSRRVHNDG
jgi:uncharacterized LabA/DUF88 family protein